MRLELLVHLNRDCWPLREPHPGKDGTGRTSQGQLVDDGVVAARLGRLREAEEDGRGDDERVVGH